MKASEIPLISVFLFSQKRVSHKPTLLSHHDCCCTSADKLWKFWLPKNHWEHIYFLLLGWCLPPTGMHQYTFTHIHQGFFLTSRITSNQLENTTCIRRHNVTASCSFQYPVNMHRNHFLVPEHPFYILLIKKVEHDVGKNSVDPTSVLCNKPRTVSV